MAAAAKGFDTLSSIMAEVAVLAQSPIYQDVVMVCQDSRISGSRLLLALAYPLLTEILKGRDEDELVLLLPDFLTQEVTDMVTDFLEERLNVKEQQDTQMEEFDYGDYGEAFENTEDLDPLNFLNREDGSDEETLPVHGDWTVAIQFDFPCGECDKKFVKQSQLEKHTRKYHNRNIRFKCETCRKMYSTRNRLKKHAAIHSVERPYQCRNEGCSKTFKTSGTRRIHERSEMGDKPFKCDFCPGAFARADHLKKHTLIHTGERNFECQYCSKRFVQKGNKNTHELKCTAR